jgi:folate-binding Fe-S cluster repair protein YgfZ
MAKHRGRPPTRLVRLVLDAGPLPARDAALVDGAATVGRVTTVVHGRAGGLEALGYLRTERAIVGARFALADARAATVIAVA